MKVIHARTVNEALPQGLRHLAWDGELQSSRAGDVVVSPVPVTTVYHEPSSKVLTSVVRDANPFFSMLESLWMLAGRNDSAFLDHYIKDFGARFAEPGGDVHGAYGYRWRNKFGFDQLDAIVEKLKKNPDDRQCVLQMWGADLRDNYGDLEGNWRDRPCNTHVYFRLKQSRSVGRDNDEMLVRELDMTVCCRSNDMIWGAYGANAVHFAFLLDYMAARLDAVPGTHYQVSNNYHAYVSEIERLHKRIPDRPAPLRVPDLPSAMLMRLSNALKHETATPPGSRAFSPGDDCDGDIRRAVAAVEHTHREADPLVLLDSFRLPLPDFYQSMVGAAVAHRLHRLGHMSMALAATDAVPWDDWRVACRGWLERRVKP
jgi:thymidylate synthase